MTTKQKYLVTAKTGYAGKKEGDEVELDLTEEQKRRAVERGSLKPVDAKPKPKKDEEEEKDG
jgi:hypothetical protein